MSSWVSIGRPTSAPNLSGRGRECQAALYAAFHDLRQQAQKAGWERREVDWAIMLLAGADLRAANANTDTAYALEQAVAKGDPSLPEANGDPADQETDSFDIENASGVDSLNIGLKLLEKNGGADAIEGPEAEDGSPPEDDVVSTGAVVDTATGDASISSDREVMPTGPAVPYDVDHLEPDQAHDQKGPWKTLGQLLKRP